MSYNNMWKKNKDLLEFKRKMGCRDSFWVTDTNEKIVENLQSEIDIGSPTDTMARDRQCEAIMALYRTQNINCIEFAKYYGRILTHYEMCKSDTLIQCMKITCSLLKNNNYDYNYNIHYNIQNVLYKKDIYHIKYIIQRKINMITKQLNEIQNLLNELEV